MSQTEDFDDLTKRVLEVAEARIRLHGDFAPLGLCLPHEGGFNRLTESVGDPRAAGAPGVEQIEAAARAESYGLRATAIASPARDGRSNLIRLVLEHQDGVASEVLVPFTRTRFWKQVTLGPATVRSIAPTVWPTDPAARGQLDRYAKARKRLDAAVAARPEPVLGLEAVEWSTSFDLADWKRFAGHLRRELGGELAEPLGTALFAAVESAPLDDEKHVLVNTRLGVVRVGWFIDDIDTVDAYIFGSSQVHDLCTAWVDEHLTGQ